MVNLWKAADAYTRNYGEIPSDNGTLIALCSAACTELEYTVKENADRSDIRLVNLAAAMAHCTFILREQSDESGVTSFKAGNVQITGEPGAALKNALSDRQAKYIAALPLLNDSGFAFMQVKT